MKAGWQSKAFEDCISKVTYTSKIQRKDFRIDGAFPVVSQEAEFINGYWDDETDLFQVVTPVVIFGDHTKVLKYVDFDFVLGADGVKILQPKDFLVPKFFYYQLHTANLDSLGYARHYKLLKELEIVYPPLPEQQRIVAILDEAFEGIATAKANAEQNLQNARALFESHLHGVFAQRGEGWVEKPLLSFAQSVSTGPFGSLLHKSDYVSDGVPLVNPINMMNCSIVPDANKMIDPATKQRLQSHVLQQGDIVVGRRGEIGRCAVVEAEQAGWVCGTGCFFIRPLQSVNPYFLANLIRSSSYREQLERASSGATMLNLSNKALSELPVAIPNLRVQNHMLAQFEILNEETQRLESIYQQKLVALDALKKSLLDQAFKGEL